MAELKVFGDILAGAGADEVVPTIDTDFIASLTSNGYVTIPTASGLHLILQWGRTGNISNSTQVNVTFPIAFPNAVFSVVPVIENATYGGSGDKACYESVNNVVTTNFNLRNGFELITAPAYWVAIGY